MIQPSIDRVTFLCDTIPALIHAIPDAELSHKPSPSKWSKKEILGHLIDSATNNHQRFVRTQFEDTPFIVYDQNNWNACSHYSEMPSAHVVAFWELYNRHIIEVIERIPVGLLERQCRTNEPEPVTLEWLIKDYVAHLEHHLRQIVDY